MNKANWCSSDYYEVAKQVKDMTCIFVSLSNPIWKLSGSYQSYSWIRDRIVSSSSNIIERVSLIIISSFDSKPLGLHEILL